LRPDGVAEISTPLYGTQKFPLKSRRAKTAVVMLDVNEHFGYFSEMPAASHV
jgi:hypothetical protein